MLKNIKLTTKLIGVLAFVILGMLIIGISSHIGFSKVSEEIKEIADYQIPLNKVIVELKTDILEEEILTYELIIASKDVLSKEFTVMEHNIKALEKVN